MKSSLSIPFIRKACRAFSLVEVVVAVGIFAIAIVSIIGLLVPLGNSVTEVRDGDDATRVATSIQAGLQDQVNRLKQDPSIADYWATFAGYLNGSTILYASRDGSIVGPVNALVRVGTIDFNIWDTDRNGNVSVDETMQRFFEVTLTRNANLSPAGAANDAAAGFLAFTITLRWPGYIRTSDTSALQINDPSQPSANANIKAQQSIMIIPAAVVR